ncbi:hypothetical protein OG897_31770 [Streptomyces sp. NBC_00237]|uniref:hypothetical protein n=1 Tax=Streptomyces sp. NBC_00237 TaxID=2975687 RepID=UPI0022562C9C|nr:hypothetical protein [Streptomyces sp. NBC_00237]MCX5205985.1 hypothetical protein [Streptomyces sp. NBC_00237]
MTSGPQTLTPDLARSVRKWKIGHHAFHLQLIVMNSTLVELQDRLENEDQQQATTLLHRLAGLYDAATATMKYAADFSPQAYDDLIRPSMAPPMLSPGFSGTMNTDHSQMVGHLRTLRATVRRLKSRGALDGNTLSGVKRLWSAQSRNRRHHMLVCERFVPGGKSQLREFLDRQPTG